MGFGVFFYVRTACRRGSELAHSSEKSERQKSWTKKIWHSRKRPLLNEWIRWCGKNWGNCVSIKNTVRLRLKMRLWLCSVLILLLRNDKSHKMGTGDWVGWRGDIREFWTLYLCRLLGPWGKCFLPAFPSICVMNVEPSIHTHHRIVLEMRKRLK